MNNFSEKNTRAYYDSFGEVYELIWDAQVHTGYFDRPKSLELACKDMNFYLAGKARITPNKKVLDVGCGRGGAGRFLALEYDADIVGIDISQNQLRHAEAESKRKGLVDKVRYI